MRWLKSKVGRYRDFRTPGSLRPLPSWRLRGDAPARHVRTWHTLDRSRHHRLNQRRNPARRSHDCETRKETAEAIAMRDDLAVIAAAPRNGRDGSSGDDDCGDKPAETAQTAAGCDEPDHGTLAFAQACRSAHASLFEARKFGVGRPGREAA